MLSMEMQNFLRLREDEHFPSGYANQKFCWVKLSRFYALASMLSI